MFVGGPARTYVCNRKYLCNVSLAIQPAHPENGSCSLPKVLTLQRGAGGGRGGIPRRGYITWIDNPTYPLHDGDPPARECVCPHSLRLTRQHARLICSVFFYFPETRDFQSASDTTTSGSNNGNKSTHRNNALQTRR